MSSGAKALLAAGAVPPAVGANDEAVQPPQPQLSLPARLRRERVLTYDLARYPFPTLVSALLCEDGACEDGATSALHDSSDEDSNSANNPVSAHPDTHPDADADADADAGAVVDAGADAGVSGAQWQPAVAMLTRLHRTRAARTWLRGVKSNGSRAYAVRRNVFDCRFKAATPFRGDGSSAASAALNQCYHRFLREVCARTNAATRMLHPHHPSTCLVHTPHAHAPCMHGPPPHPSVHGACVWARSGWDTHLW